MAQGGLPAAALKLPLRVLLENAKKWLRGAGGARPVPGIPRGCPRVAKWPQARPRCPARISLAQGGVALAVGNHLFAVASTKMQLRAHGMVMAHGRDLGFSQLSSNTLAPTCMDTLRVTYTASTHTNTVHTIQYGTVVPTLTNREGTGQLK